MLSFDEFKATRERKTPAEAAEALARVSTDDFHAEAIALHIFDEGLFVEEDSDGTFHCPIAHDYFDGTLEQMTATLYLEWYVSECVSEHTLGGLCDLLPEWCKWNGQTHASADEILAEIFQIEPKDRSAADQRRIVWLQWFIREWEQLEDAATAGPHA